VPTKITWDHEGDNIRIMKKQLILSHLIFIIIMAGCNSGTGRNKGPVSGNAAGEEVAGIKFNEYEHDLGKVAEGEKVAYVFPFVNNGPGDLVIKSAVTSCGCTVTKYDKNPIAPGKGGSIEVVFDTSGRNGIQSKTISVKSNSKIPVVILKITAEVISKQ
jgi:hypothetical protein